MCCFCYKIKIKQLRFWDMKLSIWSVLSKSGKKSCSQMFDIDSISVQTEVCFITQETLQSLWWRQVKCPFPGPCIKVNGLSVYFLYCWSCSSKSSSPYVDCISASPSSPHQPFFLKSKKVP